MDPGQTVNLNLDLREALHTLFGDDAEANPEPPLYLYETLSKDRVITLLHRHQETMNQYSGLYENGRLDFDLVLSILMLGNQGDLDDIPEVLPRQHNLVMPLRDRYVFLYRENYAEAGSGRKFKFSGRGTDHFPKTGQFGFRLNHSKGAFRYELIDDQKAKVNSSPILIVAFHHNDRQTSWPKDVSGEGGGGGEEATAVDGDGPLSKRNRVRSIPCAVGTDGDNSDTSGTPYDDSADDDSNDDSSDDDDDESAPLSPGPSLADDSIQETLKVLCVSDTLEAASVEVRSIREALLGSELKVVLENPITPIEVTLASTQTVLEASPYNFIFVTGQASRIASSKEFVSLLSRYNSLKAVTGVFLNSSSDEEAKVESFAGLSPGQHLSNCGVANVVFIEGTVADETKQSFSAAFFKSLAQSGLQHVESAFNFARSYVESQGGKFAEEAPCYRYKPQPPPRLEIARKLKGYEHDALSHYAADRMKGTQNAEVRRAHTSLTLRPYQEELLNLALDANVVVCLPTGGGKTLVAFKLMTHMIKQEQTAQQGTDTEQGLGRPVVFLTQNVSLMFQQASACEAQTKLHVGKYCGGEHQVGGEKSVVGEESLQPAWCQEIASKQACFFTGGLFENLCKRGITCLQDFSLVVFDEAHHTKKGHVFNVIMKEHYFTLAPRHRPKVLALSATLAEPQGDIKTTVDATLEKALALDCKLVVPTSPEAKATLREAINLPVIEFKKISPQPDFDRWLQVFQWYMVDCVRVMNTSGLPEDMLSPKTCEKLCIDGTLLTTVERCLFWSYEDSARKPLAFVLRHMVEVLEALDVSTGFVAEKIEAISQKLQELEQEWGSRPDEGASAKISIAFVEMIRASKLYTALKDGSMGTFRDAMSPRTFALLDILEELQKSLNPASSVMLFCTTRVAAVTLTDIINRRFGKESNSCGGSNDGSGGGGGDVEAGAPIHFCPRANYIIGHGNRDNETKGMSPHQQIQRGEEFKSGCFNVLVSTSVCKEGIDVGSCKVGIEHGGLASSTELTQFMGRVRAREGTIYVIGDSTDELRLTNLRTGRERFTQALPEAVLAQTEQVCGRRQFVEQDALYVLEKWTETFSGTVEAFTVRVDKAKPSYPKMNSYEATVFFPVNDKDIPQKIVGESRSTETSARMAAAYKACTLLLELGHDLPAGPKFSSIVSDRKNARQKQERQHASTDKEEIARKSTGAAASAGQSAGGAYTAAENDWRSPVLTSATPKALDFDDDEEERIVLPAALNLSGGSCSDQRHGTQSQGSGAPSSDLYDEKLSFKTSSSRGRDTSMKVINESCQKKKWLLHFTNELKEGPSHDPDFSVTCVVKDKDGNAIASAQGRGKKIKEARHAAAQSAFGALIGKDHDV